MISHEPATLQCIPAAGPRQIAGAPGIAGSWHRAVYEAWIEEHLADFEVLAITETTTAEYAGVRIALTQAGRPIPANDAWIAALALEHRLPVLTRDEHFDAVPGLRCIGW